MNRFRRIVLLGMLAFLMPGCQDNPAVVVPLVDPALGGGTGAGGVTIDSIVVTPATSTIAINESQLYQATALDAAGDPISNVAFFWNTSDITIATIDANGLASAIVPGTVEITASSGSIFNDPPAELIVDCGGLPDSINNAVIVPPTVSTFGTASITVDVTDCNGDPVPNGTQVDFQLTPGSLGSVTSPGATVQQGAPPLAQATSTFTALNQGGNGTITISSGDATPASVNVTVAPPGAGSIEFVSAVPTIIGVKGASQPETSVITFSVRDENGNPVADGTQIDFEMIGPNCISQLPEPFDDVNNNGVYDPGENFDDRDLSGDYTNVTSDCPNPADDLNDEFITPIQGSTLGGFVSVTLHSGKVAGPVKIIATVHGQILSTGTTGVSIGGGVPSASGFHISATDINIAGHVFFGGYDDQTSDLTAFIKDRFGNSNVLTGTSISFLTEAGTLVSSDITADTSGTVVTTVTSQGTIPFNVHQQFSVTVTSSAGQNELDWVDPIQIGGRGYPDPAGDLIGGTPLTYDLYWTTSLDRFPNELLGVPFDNDGTGWNKLPVVPAVGSPTFTHSGLSNGTPYFYVLVASDDNGRVAQSSLLSGTPRTSGQITGQSGITEPSYPDIYPTMVNESITTAIRNPRDGWVTITAIVQGEETFFDANGNGFYDIGEEFIDTPGEPFVDADDNGLYTTPETFVDLNQNGIYDFGEPFNDDNDNGLYDEGDTVYLDANDNDVWDGPNGIWDSNTFIWNTIRLVFSGEPFVDNADDVLDGEFAPFNSPPQTGSRIEINTFEFPKRSLIKAVRSLV